jgi:hypothetical protein
MEWPLEDPRMRQTGGPQALEIDGEPSLDQRADAVRRHRRAGGLDEAHVQPVVRVEQHEEAAALREHVLADHMLLAPAVFVVRPRRLHGPVGLQEGEAASVRERPGPIVSRQHDPKVTIGLGAHRREREVEQRLDQLPVARAGSRHQRDPNGQRLSACHRSA